MRSPSPVPRCFAFGIFLLLSQDHASSDFESIEPPPSPSDGVEPRSGSKGENDDDGSIENDPIDDHYSSMAAEEYIEVQWKQKLIFKSQKLELIFFFFG